MTKTDPNELYLIWRRVFKLDKEYISKKYRKEQRFNRFKFFKYDIDIIQQFWTLKAKLDSLEQQIEDLNKEIKLHEKYERITRG